MQFHILSFEGPDLYSRAGGLATRVDGLAEALAMLGFETHLWFVGSIRTFPGTENHDPLHLHRWCQWISRTITEAASTTDERDKKSEDYCASLPSHLFEGT